MLNNLGKHLALHMARSKQLMEGMDYSWPVFRSTFSKNFLCQYCLVFFGGGGGKLSAALYIYSTYMPFNRTNTLESYKF